MLEWVKVVENKEDSLLDEVGDPQRPLRFITEVIEEEEAYPQQEENPPRLERGRRSQTRSSQTTLGTRDTQPSHSTA